MNTMTHAIPGLVLKSHRFELPLDFRADNIVRDVETIRKALIGEKQWSILGYSFGERIYFNFTE